MWDQICKQERHGPGKARTRLQHPLPSPPSFWCKIPRSGACSLNCSGGDRAGPTAKPPYLERPTCRLGQRRRSPQFLPASGESGEPTAAPTPGATPAAQSGPAGRPRQTRRPKGERRAGCTAAPRAAAPGAPPPTCLLAAAGCRDALQPRPCRGRSPPARLCLSGSNPGERGTGPWGRLRRPNSAQRALCWNYVTHEALRGRRFLPEGGSQKRGRSAEGIVGERVVPFRLAAAIR